MSQILMWTWVIILSLNLLTFLLAYVRQTDRYTDLAYCLSFAASTVVAFAICEERSGLKMVLLGMVGLWALRLGIYLFIRIHRMGSDWRFQAFRGNAPKLLAFFLFQAVSVWIVALPIFVAMARPTPAFGYWQVSGLGIWLCGWFLEAIADRQKSRFKRQRTDTFLRDGLYAYVRYPNYTGEILCWLGVFLFAMPAFQGVDWLSAISPLWITILLIFVSGIPHLERSRRNRWNSDPSYEAYVRKTYKLIPFIY